MAMCFSNNKQMYSYTNSASFAVLYFRVTSFNINLELFEKYQSIKESIRCNGKVLEKLRISKGIHELADFVEVYSDWQEIRCT